MTRTRRRLVAGLGATAVVAGVVLLWFAQIPPAAVWPASATPAALASPLPPGS